jgi:hypothetical protein
MNFYVGHEDIEYQVDGTGKCGGIKGSIVSLMMGLIRKKIISLKRKNRIHPYAHKRLLELTRDYVLGVTEALP